MVILFAGFILFAETVFSYLDKPVLDKSSPDTTGIAVLTGGRNRIGKGIELLLAGYGARLMISGVKPNVSLEEIAAHDGIVLTQNLAVDLGYKATDTVGNAKEIKAWVKENEFDKVYAVTSFYHIPRSRLELEHEISDMDIRFYAVQTGYVVRQWWRSLGSFKFLAAEYIKFLIVYVQYKLLRL